MKIVAVEEVERLRPDAQVVEVLPREEFEWAHLPGALHIPLRRLGEQAGELLDQRRPVVVYCNDFL